MKKLIALTLLLCTLALLLSSCGDNKIEKPEDTNLEYWLFDTPDMSDYTEIFSNHPSKESFLAKGYEAIIDEKGRLREPDKAVVYDIQMYPYADLNYGSKRVSCITITDPSIYVWGLNIYSTREEIIKTLEEVGYKIYAELEGISISFRLSSDEDWRVSIRYDKSIEISCDFAYFYQL